MGRTSTAWWRFERRRHGPGGSRGGSQRGASVDLMVVEVVRCRGMRRGGAGVL
jgi:hypothetical protein